MKNFSKKIIAFSLWGNNPKYVVGAIKNAELAKLIYPGWICRFYVGKSTVRDASSSISYLQNFDHVEVVKMDEEGDWRGMFWRFYPIGDNDIDVMISRDTDSRLSLREKYAVEQWLKSGKKFHIMRDHPYHTFKILGGMWGARKGVLKDMKDLIKDYNKSDYWQVDQDFLAEIVYPRIIDDSYIHDEFGVGLKFPRKRKKFDFVGDVYDENDEQKPELKNVLKEYIEYNQNRQNLMKKVSRFFKI